MKFRVIRTKSWSRDECEPPIDGCIKEACKLEFLRGGKLVTQDTTDWFIELNTLEDLLAFQKKSGHELILTQDGFYGVGYTIEIYDGYRE